MDVSAVTEVISLFIAAVILGGIIGVEREDIKLCVKWNALQFQPGGRVP